jgi:hypothetical protein
MHSVKLQAGVQPFLGAAMNNQVEALEALHKDDAEDLHFRFIGAANDRQFVVNVQFASVGDKTSEKLKPVEYDFIIGKVLGLILKYMASKPNPGLH